MTTDTTHLRKRCKVAQQCLPDAPYRKQLEALHDELLGAIDRLTKERDALAVRVGQAEAENARLSEELAAANIAWDRVGEAIKEHEELRTKLQAAEAKLQHTRHESRQVCSNRCETT